MDQRTAPSPSRRALLFVLALIGCGLSVVAGALPSSAAVSVGHSGWFWGDPRPQGNDLRVFEAFGNRGYAAGAFGTVLRTDDAGATWSGLRTGTIAPLSDIDVINESTVVVGGNCSLRRSDNGGASFKRLPFSASESRCSSNIGSFDFATAQAGFILLEDGTVLQTADGGESFAQRTAIPGTAATGASGPMATDIVFTAPGTGFAVTGRTDSGRIYRTTDSAGSWTQVASSPRGLRGVHFPSASTGYAVGTANTLLKSTDGGATWSPRALAGAPEGNELTDIRCSGTETCLTSTEAGDRLLRTTDGGETGSSVTPSTGRVLGAAFASANRAVAVGADGTTVVSDTAGVTFAPIGGRLVSGYFRLRAASSRVAYASGRNGRIARTTDGGASWSSIGVSTADDIVDVAFPTLQLGYTLDATGTALRTTNGGASWRILDTGTETRPRAIVAPRPRLVLLVGPRGVRRSTDGGEQFSAVRSPAVRRTALSDAETVGGSIVAFGARNLVVSDSGGARWTKLALPKGRGEIRDVDFTSSSSGYLLKKNGRLFFTSSRGKRWTESLSLGRGDVLSLAFGDRGHGFVNTTDGEVLRTDDGSRSWQRQLISSFQVASIAAVGPRVGFALSPPTNGPRDDHFFATDSGGVGGRASRLSIRTAATRVRRGAKVRITGTLRPAQGGEDVSIIARRSGGYVPRRVRVASNGAFSATFTVPGTTQFVAQWRGDDARAGDGTEALEVKVGQPKKKPKAKRRR